MKYLWHSLLTSKSEVGCEALSSSQELRNLWRIYGLPLQVQSKFFLPNPKNAKKSWLVDPPCWGSTTIICLLIPHVLQCGNAIYYGTQHQSKVTEGSAAIPATAHPQINSQLSKANLKGNHISAQQAQAKRPALDTRRSEHLLCAAARQNVWKRLPGSLEIIRNYENPDF